MEVASPEAQALALAPAKATAKAGAGAMELAGAQAVAMALASEMVLAMEMAVVPATDHFDPRKDLHGGLIKCWRAALKVDVHHCAHVSGCVSAVEYLDCEGADRRPPLGWKPVILALQEPLRKYMEDTNGDTPAGMNRLHAGFILREK